MKTFREGGAVVVYPAGEIESDPAVFADTPEFLREWPPVLDGIQRRLNREGLRVPVVPVYTEGVHHVPGMLRWLVGPGRSQKAREGRAALITMITRLARSRPIRVAIGEPHYANAASDSAGPYILTASIRATLHDLERRVAPLRPSPAVRRSDSSARATTRRRLYPLTAPDVSPRTTPR